MDLVTLIEKQLHEFTKPRGVIIPDCFRITKGLLDRISAQNFILDIILGRDCFFRLMGIG